MSDLIETNDSDKATLEVEIPTSNYISKSQMLDKILIQKGDADSIPKLLSHILGLSCDDATNNNHGDSHSDSHNDHSSHSQWA